MFRTFAASYPIVSSGKVRALALSSPERSKQLPDVPTIAEIAVPGCGAFEWNGMLLPAGTPEPIVTKLQKALVEVLQEEAIAKRFCDLGVEPIGPPRGVRRLSEEGRRQVV